jgi:small lipoprotein (TIGR04454 family)
VVVLAACSSRAPAPTGPDEPRGSGEAAAPGSGNAVGSGSAAVSPGATKVTEAQCHAMIDHLIDVDVKARPADQQIGADEQAQVAAQVRQQHLPACMKLPREMVACIMAATTVAAIEACEK